MKIRPVGAAKYVQAEGGGGNVRRRDRHDETNSGFPQFYERAKQNLSLRITTLLTYSPYLRI